MAQRSPSPHAAPDRRKVLTKAVIRAAPVSLIRYESVRDPQKGGCLAVLEPGVFAAPEPLAYQTWFLTVTLTASAWQRDGEKFEFVWA